MDDEMWELFREIKNEEDKQNKISNGIDDNEAGGDIIKCECGSTDYLIEDNMHICKSVAQSSLRLLRIPQNGDIMEMRTIVMATLRDAECLLIIFFQNLQ